MTVLELLTASMHRLGYLESTETPRAADVVAVKQAANDWIDQMKLDDLLVYRIARHVFNLAANTASYTIGTGGTFNTARPVSIDRCGVITDPTASIVEELALGVPLSVQEYAHVPNKALTGQYPTRVYYDPTITSGFGTVHVHPVPDSSTPDLVLYLAEQVSELGADATDLTLAPGYRRLLIANIAVEAASILGVTPSEDLYAAAADAKAAIQRSNVRIDVLQVPAGTPGLGWTGGYDIRRG